MYKRKKKKMRALMFSMALVATLLPTSLMAQDEGKGLFVGFGGLFGLGPNPEETELFLQPDQVEDTEGLFNMPRGGTGGYNLFNQQFGAGANGGYELYNQTFGQDNEGPVGSGLAILMVAGMGYAAMKSRKKNQKSNK